jgi:hypothetical protein
MIYTSKWRDLAMIAKKVVIVSKPFKDRDGRDRKPGDRMEVDPEYGQEIIRQGNGREDNPEATNPIAGQPDKAEPK